MQRAHVLLRMDDLPPARVRPGGLIGRTASAELRVVEPRVSEAHALVVLRAAGFQMLALRGELRVEGAPEDTVDLDPGTVVELAPGIKVEVVEVVLPDEAIAIEVGGQPAFLWADTYSLVRSPEPELVPGYRVDALCYVLSSGSGWAMETPERGSLAIHPGDAWSVDGLGLRAVLVPVADMAGHRTLTTYSGTGLEIVARYETVHLQRQGREPVILAGLPARLLTELGEMNSPVPWETVSAELWADVDDREALRRRYDRVVRRLRIQLREHGIRDDLVRPTGTGSVELFLHPEDRFRTEA